MDTKIQAICNQLVVQRNTALDALASVHGELAAANEKIAALQALLDALSPPAPATA